MRPMEGWRKAAQWLLAPEPATSDKYAGHLVPRWIFLRGLGLIYFSAFYPLLFQIKGLIGPEGILPASKYLELVDKYRPGFEHFWIAPTLFWLSQENGMLMLVCWLGLLASLAVVFNFWPRISLLICLLCYLSFVAAAQDFSGYQSDGMLLEAGFISLFFAPPGLRPGLAEWHPPTRASLFLLRWEWFRIYFESGLVKILSGDYSWRHLTAMDDYYQNGPLPSWIGWYVQHLPHWFHASATLLTLIAELVLVFMLFLPRRWKIACFLIVTPFQITIILTGNYTFLNYLVLLLGVLLLDDKLLASLTPARWRMKLLPVAQTPNTDDFPQRDDEDRAHVQRGFQRWLQSGKRVIAAWALVLVFYVTLAGLLDTLQIGGFLPDAPVRALTPFRIANSYGLFAVMTHERYEIEFQGSNDGKTWVAYPFSYKPQDIYKAPGLYAPYQPRLDWNLWFASLGQWRQNIFVIQTEERLLRGSPDVLSLFAGNPFAGAPPQRIRTVLWQYWFTDLKTKRDTGAWWRRKLLGPYSPGLERAPNGQIVITESGDRPEMPNLKTVN
jgi:lipase maturation factor 1